jgi:hypothetical protein
VLQGNSTSNPGGSSQTISNPALQAPRHSLKPGSASTALTRQLAELSINLDDQACLMLPLSIHRPGSDPRPNVPYFSLDRTFQLTQSLVDLYPQFIKTFIHKEPSDLRQPLFDCLSSLDPPREPPLDPIPNFDEASRTSNPAPVLTSNISGQRNHASILLILSCHHRLIDMWKLMFSHIYATPADTLGQHCLKFKIGSFMPSTLSSAVPVEIIMIVELAA